MKEKVVYLHRKATDDTIFYVGIGSKKRSKSKKSRNPYWINTVNKYGYYVEIIKEGLSQEEACELEIFLISEIGRKDLGEGTLVNMTDGGEGRSNVNNKIRKKIIESNRKNMKAVSQYDNLGNLVGTYRSISFASKQTEISRQSIRDCVANKSKTAGGYVWQLSSVGYEHDKDRFDNGSNSMKGSNNAMSKIVLNLQTGIYYDSISCAYKSQNQFKERGFKAQLSGQNKNRTPFIIIS